MQEFQMDGVRERREMHTEFWWESQKENRLEHVSVDGRIIVKMDLKETGFEGANWIDLSLYSGQVAISCELATDPSVTVQ